MEATFPSKPYLQHTHVQTGGAGKPRTRANEVCACRCVGLVGWLVMLCYVVWVVADFLVSSVRIARRRVGEDAE
jgi:hypothetical protein